MAKLEAVDVRNLMNEFLGGSERRFRHPLMRKFIYTEGVKAVAELAGAYWLLDILATEVAPICLKEWETKETPLFSLQFNVHPSGSAQITLPGAEEDSALWTKTIHMTDFPEGEWTFMLGMDGLIDSPNEVLVMYLLQEH